MPNPPEGLPGYGWERLLELAGMASVSMLKRDRRRPADGQNPVGYYWSGHAHVLLYRAADAVDMPALSAGRQRLYDQARTCASCGTRRTTTLEKGRDGQRYCEPCQGPAAERLWRAERAADRPTVTMWAQGVLADESLLAAAESHLYWRQVRIEDLAGQVLLDARVRHNTTPIEQIGGHTDFTGTVSPAELTLLQEWTGRRLIAWTDWTAPNIDPAGNGPSRVLTVRADDQLGRWWDRWVGVCAGGHYRSPVPRVETQPYPRDPVEQVARMRHALTEMARGVPTAAAAPVAEVSDAER